MILESDKIKSVEAIPEGGYRVHLARREGEILDRVIVVPFDPNNPDFHHAHAAFTKEKEA